VTPLAEESGLLAQLRAAAEQGRYDDVLERLRALPPSTIEGSTAFALLAAESHGRVGHYAEAQTWRLRWPGRGASVRPSCGH